MCCPDAVSPPDDPDSIERNVVIYTGPASLPAMVESHGWHRPWLHGLFSNCPPMCTTLWTLQLRGLWHGEACAHRVVRVRRLTIIQLVSTPRRSMARDCAFGRRAPPAPRRKAPDGLLCLRVPRETGAYTAMAGVRSGPEVCALRERTAGKKLFFSHLMHH